MAKKRSKDGTSFDIAALEAEKRDLCKSGLNPVRLDKVKKLLDFIYWGIK